MTLSDISVRRPVFAAVAAIVLCVIGLVSFSALSVRELPSVDPPVVSISTVYRGASAEVVEDRITQVIERQIAGIQGVDRVQSNSRDGVSRISITFRLDRNIEDATNDVRDAVSRVITSLPDQAEAPQIAKADADAFPIMFLALSSTTLNRLQLSDYATRYLVERFSVVPGVAQVALQGDLQYSMRIWLDADAMASRGITVADVEAALNRQNLDLPAGELETDAKDFTIRVARGYTSPAEFARLPVSPGAQAAEAMPVGAAAIGGAAAGAGAARGATKDVATAAASAQYVTRLGDIARIEEAPEERRRLFRMNGVEQVGIRIHRQSQANDLEISKGVREVLEEVNASLPKGTRLAVMVDFTEFTNQAIREVWITMAISLAMVALVNFVFLGTARAAIVPTVVAPICILSTFIVLAAFGFSINLLTLLALVLAIGLVVDDAIVVVENIQRRIDDGEPPLVAAQRGARQVFFAVVATTLVLVTVFAPLMFIPGYIGKLFVELAVAVVAAIGFSALLALSLSPMLSSKLLRPASTEGPVARFVDRVMRGLRASYHASLDALLGRRAAAAAAVAMVAGLAVCAVGLFTLLPKELTPPEDRGRIQLNLQGPEGAGYNYMYRSVRQIEAIVQRHAARGEVRTLVMGLPAFNGAYNGGFGNVALPDKNRPEGLTTEKLAATLNREFSSVTSLRVIAASQSGFQSAGPGSQGGMDLILLGDDYPQILRQIEPLLRAAQQNPGLARVRLNYEPTSPRVLVNIDREKAATLGISQQEVGRALETMFGARQVTTYIKGGQEYDVLLQAEPSRRQSEQDLNKLYVRTDAGLTVPLSSIVTTQIHGDSPNRQRIDRLRSITLSAQLNPGYSIGEAVDFFRAEIAKQSGGMNVKWGGTARDYLDASSAVGVAFGMALLLVFLVLAAQFESWIHPAVIMLTVPVAALGGLFGLLVADSSINTYSQIGMIILVGIAAKNGILIVEFANQLRDQGLSVRESVIEASSLRLRPIVMTSISAAAGAIPLIFWGGAGGESRRTIGVVIFFGAIFTTMITLFVVPVFYNMFARFTKSPQATARRIEAFEAHEKIRAANAAE